MAETAFAFPVKYLMIWNPATPNPCPATPGQIGVLRWDILVSSGYDINYDGIGEIESCGAKLRTRMYVQFDIGSMPPPALAGVVSFRVYRVSPVDTRDTAFFVDRGFQPYPRNTPAIGNTGLVFDWVGGGFENTPLPITGGTQAQTAIFGPAAAIWNAPALWTSVQFNNPNSWRAWYSTSVVDIYRQAKTQGHRYLTLRVREVNEGITAPDSTQVQWHGIASAASSSIGFRPLLTFEGAASVQSAAMLPVTLELTVLEPCVLNLGLAIPDVPAMLDFQRMGITPVRRGNTVGISVLLVDHLTVPPRPVNGAVFLTLRDQSGTVVLSTADMHRVGAGMYRYSYWTKDEDPLTLYTAEFDYAGAGVYVGPAADGL